MTAFKCICDFPATCGGTEVLDCRGCGGDLCACAACFGHGTAECPGCEDCAPDLDWNYEPEDAP